MLPNLTHWASENSFFFLPIKYVWGFHRVRRLIKSWEFSKMTAVRHKICTGHELEDLNGAVALQAAEREHLFFSISFILQLFFIISCPFSVSRLFFSCLPCLSPCPSETHFDHEAPSTKSVGCGSGGGARTAARSAGLSINGEAVHARRRCCSGGGSLARHWLTFSPS